MAGAFGEGENAVDGGDGEGLAGAIGPGDGGGDVGFRAEAEVEAEVAGAAVAGAAADLVDPGAFAALKDDVGADGVAVGFCPDELEAEPVVGVGGQVD